MHNLLDLNICFNKQFQKFCWTSGPVSADIASLALLNFDGQWLQDLGGGSI